MKKIIYSTLIFFFTTLHVFSQSVGIGTTTPDNSAILDVSSATKGFLPPRLALIATNIAAPVTNPATGLLVYNTATSGTTPTNVVPGYYYWSGSIWYPVVNKGNVYGDMQFWNGTQWVMIPAGTQDQVLTWCNGKPVWGSCPPAILTISLANNQFEGQIDSYNSNSWGNGDSQIDIAAWTAFGSPENQRSCIKFDFSSIPQGSIIDSARLFLYATPDRPTHGGNGIDPNTSNGSGNAGYAQRITSPWPSLPATYTWNNQPATTATNQAIIPQSTSTISDVIVDVTALVKDMLLNGNNGFLLRLQVEATYNIRQFASSFNSNASKHPTLVIYYH